jgi:hypothetical protein
MVNAVVLLNMVIGVIVDVMMAEETQSNLEKDSKEEAN